MNDVTVAVITSAFTLIGVIITVIAGSIKTNKSLKAQTDLTLYRIQQLEIKQEKHNTLIERVYKLEERCDVQDERQKVANHRIDDLEHCGSGR